MKKRTRVKVAAGNRVEDHSIVASLEFKDLCRTNPFRAAHALQHGTGPGEPWYYLLQRHMDALKEDVPRSQADCDIIGWIGVALEEQAAHEQYKHDIWNAIRELVKLIPAEQLRELVTSPEFTNWACKHTVLMR